MSTPEKLTLENPIAAIGKEDIIIGFKALGFKTYPIKEKRDFKAACDEVVKNRYAVCLVEEEIYNSFRTDLESFRKLPLPIFIPFSKTSGKDLLGDTIKKIRLRATGTV